MTMKEIGLKGGRASLDPLPLDPPMLLDVVMGGYGMRQKHCAGIFKVTFPYLPYPY